MASYLTLITVILVNLIFNGYDFYVYRAWTSAYHAANVDYHLLVLFSHHFLPRPQPYRDVIATIRDSVMFCSTI